jgi:hypothetical protein
MSIRPNKLLKVYASISGVNSTDTNGVATAWNASLSVTPQPHSNPAYGTDGFYTGNDVKVGDWVATSNSGQALRIKQINTKNQNTVICVLEDVQGMNAAMDQAQESSGGIQSGWGVLFEEINGMPILYPLPDALPGGFTPTFALQLVNRFFVANNGFSGNASNLKLDTAIPGISGSTVTAALAELQTNKVSSSNVGAANGVASLGADGKIPSSQIPAIAITDTFVVSSQSAMLALSADVGDVAIRTDVTKSFILKSLPASTIGNWQELLSPASDAIDAGTY